MAKNFGFVLLAVWQQISNLYFWPYGKNFGFVLLAGRNFILLLFHMFIFFRQLALIFYFALLRNKGRAIGGIFHERQDGLTEEFLCWIKKQLGK
jgi:hypothetical protein